jgi:PAS domain S-box-containing protein
MGEEAYSVAICVLQALGNRWREIPLLIFSTDADADALSRASVRVYPRSAVRGMTSAQRKRFFIQEAGGFRAQKFVRDICRFMFRDLSKPPPYTRLDLIVCGQAPAAWPASARDDAARLFHSALAPGGLLIGGTEYAEGRPELFTRIDGEPGFYAARIVPRNDVLRLQEATTQKIVVPDVRLLENDEQFRALFSQAEDALLVRDVGTDVILTANEAAQHLYGRSLSELMGMRGKDFLVSPEAVRRPEGERRSEERLRLPHHSRKDGRLFPADTKTTFFMLRGRPSDLWTVRDASDRLRIKFNRRRADEQNSFVGEIIHELRSPLAVIRCFAETIRRGDTKAQERFEFLKKIECQTGRMGHLIDRLLDLSAAHAVNRPTNPSPILLADVIWEMVTALVPMAKRRGVSIKVDIAEELTALADRSDLPHIFGNLLDNAIKFNRRGGEIRVRGRAENGRAIISVQDTGVGIPFEDLNRIFERFYRSERTRSTKGTGLGLAIVRGIVEANGGRIWAQNAPDSGSIFHVALPLTIPTECGSRPQELLRPPD